MNILERGEESIVQCERCHVKMEVESGDLKWSHNEQDDYYVKCPVCGATIWITGTPYWDKFWKEQ